MTTLKLHSARYLALLTICSLVLSALPASFFVAFAASTGVTVNDTTLTTQIGVKVNFIVETVTDNASTTDGTYVSVSDNGGNGSFYNGTNVGACNSNTVDSDNQFAIEQTKGVCYSNATAGVYSITVQLLDGSGGQPIGAPETVSVTVEAPVVADEPIVTTSLTLEKIVDGGEADEEDWTLIAEGAEGFSGKSGVSKTFESEDFESATLQFTLSEEPADDSDETNGYQGSNWVCEGNATPLQNGNLLTLYPGEEVTCGITNEYLLDDEDDEEYLVDMTACKYDETEDALAGWEMTFTNDKNPIVATTTDNGCVTVEVDLFEGPWSVFEEERTGYSQVDVFASEGGTVIDVPQSEDELEGCEFIVPKYNYDRVVEEGYVRVQGNWYQPEYRCTFVNEMDDVPPPCADAVNVGATSVVNFSQGDKKVGPITDVNRKNQLNALGAPNWTNGNETTFFSLGFGGTITLSFAQHVNNVPGVDLRVYEATNGTYPLEKANVFVSQDGNTWLLAGVASNTASDRKSDIDFASTSLPWIKYVRIVDTTNAALHNNDADGFDVDAVVAVKTTCEPPREPGQCTVTIVSDTTNTVVEKGGLFAKVLSFIHPAWTAGAGVSNPAQWIWGDDPVTDPVNESSQTFEKKFGWNGPITSAVLTLAADNAYEVMVNGNVFGSDATEFNYSAPADTHDLASVIDQGNNTLSVAVRNFAQQNGTPATNPAGLKYSLVITGTDPECDVPYMEPPCKDELAVGANSVTSSAQGTKKVGPITDALRMNPFTSLGSPNWVDGGATGFFSLGFGGTITLAFTSHVNEVLGTDLKIYEATNGADYPIEQAIVEVSQDGSVWFVVGTANNASTTRITNLDFSSSGLTWIKYVRLTDTTNPALHNNDADGFDLDAVVAVKTTCQPPIVDLCPNLAGVQVTLPVGYTVNNAGQCVPPPPVNTCLIPNTLGASSTLLIKKSNEKTIAEMMATHGYGSVSTSTDQKSYQVWDVASGTATTSFTARVLGKRAQNTQVFGYYRAGNNLSFANILTQSANTDGESSVSVDVPASVATSVGFAIVSAGKTWFTEQALNTDGKDHVAVFNPLNNVYLLAFEDLNNLGDQDYNDLLVEIKNINCLPVTTPEDTPDDDTPDTPDGDDPTTDNPGGGGSGSSGTRVAGRGNPSGRVEGESDSAMTTPTPQAQVLGDQVSAVPYGAPNTGRGGAAEASHQGVASTLILVLMLLTLMSRFDTAYPKR